jgi:hypothetical protein
MTNLVLIGLGAAGLFTFGVLTIDFTQFMREEREPWTPNDLLLVALFGLAFVNSGAVMYMAVGR